MPVWVKVAIDAWTTPAGVVDGYVFRSVNRGDQVQGNVLSEKVVWQMLRPYAAAAGVPGIAPHDCRRYADFRTMPNGGGLRHASKVLIGSDAAYSGASWGGMLRRCKLLLIQISCNGFG